MSQRKVRLEHALRDTLAELIAADVRDPRVVAVSMLTVTKVELNVELSVAHVWVSIVGDAEQALEGLKKAAAFLRGPVGRRLSLQRAPELRFELDPGPDMADKIAQILREDEEKRKQ